MQEVINNTNICDDLTINFQNISLINLYKIGCDKLTDKNDLVKRIIPSWSNYIEINNHLKIYNICVLDNITSYNKNTEIDELDYFGFKIKYNELPNYVENCMKGFLELAITLNDIITISLPNKIENILLILTLIKLQIIWNKVFFIEQLIKDFDKYAIKKNSHILITFDGYLQFFTHHLKISKIKKVIVVSLKDFLPEYSHYLFDDSILIKSDNRKYLIKEKINEGIKECKNCNNFELLYLKDIFNIDKKSNITIKSEPIDLEKDISYFYVSGSREEPKCIVFKNKSVQHF